MLKKLSAWHDLIFRQLTKRKVGKWYKDMYNEFIKIQLNAKDISQSDNVAQRGINKWTKIKL